MIDFDFKSYLVEHMKVCKKNGDKQTTFILVNDKHIYDLIDVCHEYHLAYHFDFGYNFKEITIDLSNFTYVEKVGIIY